MEKTGEINYGFEPSPTDSDLGKINPSDKDYLHDEKMTAEEIQYEKTSIKKNLALLVLSALLVQSPFLALTNIASSLLQDDSMGFTSLAVSGVAQLLAAAFLVTYTTKVIGIRKMVTISMFVPLFYGVTFFYPVWGIVVPAGTFVGITQTVFSSTVFLYGNSLGFWYGKLTDDNIDTVMALMTGLINCALGGGFLFGNGLLYAILNSASLAVHGNSTNNETYEICGKNYCNEDISHMTTMRQPERWRYYTMIGVFSGMTALGIFLSLFLRDFSSKLGQIRRKKSELFAMTKEMCLLMKNPRGYLLVVITLFAGIEEGFALSDFTQAYISCVIGIANVGLLMSGYGVSQVVISASQWILTKYLGRVAGVILGFCLLMGCLVALSLWSPNPDQRILLVVVAVLWSSGDAMIIASVYSAYSVLFEDNVEGSFAVGQVWFSLGIMLSFIWSQLLCISVKLYIMMAVASVGLVMYVWLEILIKRKKQIKN